MDIFYESNPGLASRIANHVHFPDYSPEELLQIAKQMLAENQYKLTLDEGESVLLEYIKLRKTQPLFANARSMKNAIDRARMRQANRLFERNSEILTKAHLTTLEPIDFLQSRVFSTSIK